MLCSIQSYYYYCYYYYCTAFLKKPSYCVFFSFVCIAQNVDLFLWYVRGKKIKETPVIFAFNFRIWLVNNMPLYPPFWRPTVDLLMPDGSVHGNKKSLKSHCKSKTHYHRVTVSSCPERQGFLIKPESKLRNKIEFFPQLAPSRSPKPSARAMFVTVVLWRLIRYKQIRCFSTMKQHTMMVLALSTAF